MGIFPIYPRDKSTVIKKIFDSKLLVLITFFIINVSAFILHWYTRVFLGIYSPYVAFFAAAALSAWIGGLSFGILSTLITLFASVYFFPADFGSGIFRQAFIICLYLLEGLIISFVIDRERRSNIISQYSQKEKILTKMIMENQRKLKKVEDEINFRDEFLSIASHELKNPLTSMLLQLQMSLYNIHNVSLAKFSIQNLMTMLENAEAQTKRLSKMIGDLSNVSLITTGKFDLELRDTDLAKIVREAADHLPQKEGDGTKKISLSLNGPVVGFWDKIRLEQLVTNLLTNALKYGNNKPIEVSLKDNKDTAFLEVKDQGIGIPKDQITKIFGRFQRGNNSKFYQGLGVGLYIVSQIVKAHGGKIHLQSSLGHGSAFMVELPKKPKKKA